jgi:hypothetical protein
VPGICAKLTFDPASDTLAPLAYGATGSVTGTVEANAGGTAAKAKWTVTARANGTFAPPTAEGGSTRFGYVVTNAGSGVKLSGSFKVTSTAGVAEGTWTQKTAALAVNAPLPFEPDLNKLAADDGAYNGSITQGSSPLNATRSGTVHGCDISVNPPPPPCDTPVNLAVPVALGVIVDIPAMSSTAKVSWILPSVFVGDNGPASPCYTPTLSAVPNVETRTVPADEILRPGQHTLTVTRSVNASSSFGRVQGTTGASITFHRVNADGSNYTG